MIDEQAEKLIDLEKETASIEKESEARMALGKAELLKLF